MREKNKSAKQLGKKTRWQSGAKIHAIGLMSGTSRDGMDAALILSDGEEKITCKAAITLPYSPDFAKKLGGLCELGEKALQPQARNSIAPIEAQLNQYAEKAVSLLLEDERRSSVEEGIDASVGDSLRDSIGDSGASIGDSIEASGASIGDSGASIGDSGASIEDSGGVSIGASIGDSGASIEDSGASIEDSGASIEDSIGALAFHGHTIYHNPKIGASLQIGDGASLAEKTGLTVVSDFRSCDIKAGGQGAPLAPLYHLAIARYLRAAEPALATLPIVFLNIGGIANVTWIDADATVEAATVEIDASMLAFDTGPGNALLDDWVASHSRLALGETPLAEPLAEFAFDKDGAFARRGKCNEKILEKLMQEPFFAQKPPKSLDRKQFSIKPLEGLSLEDGAKTLTVFLAQTIRKASELFPKPAGLWLLCGGGRRNLAIVESLQEILSAPVQNIDELGFDGDALEAQAFAYLAIRRLKGKATAYPQLTGARLATSGGRIHHRVFV